MIYNKTQKINIDHNKECNDCMALLVSLMLVLLGTSVSLNMFFFFSSRRRHTRSLRDEFRRVLFRSKVESDHGRSRLPGVRSGANSAGAAGPMQIGIGGKAGDTWAAYGDGVPAHVYQPRYAIPAAARKLCRDGARSDVSRALFAY